MSTLELPVDVSWKLLGTSSDMMDMEFGDNKMPPKWRSSMAIFSYEPKEVPDEISDQKITYLKIVCSITGYQTDKVDRDFIEFKDIEPEKIDSMARHLNRYYACYGALLQIAVYPSKAADRDSLAKFPIIVDFEPKKRELVELVSDSCQTLSASIRKVAVTKGFTSTESTESSAGLTGKAEITFPIGESVKGKAGAEGKLTSEQGLTTVDQRLTNIDHSTEKRESQSHTTQLSQLYTLLQSYHLGTNRAVFLVLPRPHMVEQEEKRTFINGPRELEGIQEFFLIVSRPKDVEGICVQAHFDTGHLDLNPTVSTDRVAGFLFNFEAPRTIQHANSVSDDSATETATISKSYKPPDGYEIDTDRGEGGYRVLWDEGEAAYTVSATKTGLTVTATVVTKYHDVAWSLDDYYTYQSIEGELEIYLKRKKEYLHEDIRNTFFITSRSIKACTNLPVIVKPPFGGLLEWIVGEYHLPIDPRLSARKISPATRIQIANDLTKKVGISMLESLHSKQRYKPGTIDFHMTHLVSAYVQRAMPRQTLKDKISTVTSISSSTRNTLTKFLGNKAAKIDALNVRPERILKETNLKDPKEVLKLRWNLLGTKPKGI